MSYVISDVTTERVVVAMLVLVATQHTMSNTISLGGQSLLPRSLAEQKFVQVCKSVKQASCLACAGAWWVLVDLPLLPGVCSNDAWVLSQRLRPRLGLCFGQHEDGGWVFCNSSQRFRQRSFLRRFEGQPRHRGRFGREPRDRAAALRHLSNRCLRI